MSRDWLTKDEQAEYLRHNIECNMRIERNAIIEECAQMAEKRAREGCGSSGIIDAIRALKDKT